MAGRTDPREALPRSDRYVAGGFLGKGTHGSVWRAEDRHSRLPDGSFATVAIKTLRRVHCGGMTTSSSLEALMEGRFRESTHEMMSEGPSEMARVVA